MTKHTTPLHPRFYVYLVILLCALALIGIKSVQKMTSKARNSPICKGCNIVLIVIDPLRADALPCYGYLLKTTPNLCKFADANIRFSDMYSQSSWTLPSIMSLFTSTLPSRHRVFYPDTDVLAPSLTTLPMALKQYGYDTIFIGPSDDPTHHVPLDRGIGRGFNTILPYTTFSEAATLVENHITKANTSKPKFVFIHSFDLRNNGTKSAPTSFPLDPTYSFGHIDPYLKMKTLQTVDTLANIASYRRVYDERLRQLDLQLGAFLEKTQTSDEATKTIIAITSDHGEEFGEHGYSTHGMNLYATTTHIPFVLSIPKTSPTVNTKLAQSIDIFPTLLALVGAPMPHSSQGISLFDPSKSNTLIISQLEPEKKATGIRNKQWSYYFDPSSPATQKQGKLYMRISDPMEQNDVAAQNADIIDQLMRMYTKQLSL